ncbi:MAG UNVERIFIED_CONTAM: hypothetical protein LVR18_08060 [Planctomycetaceae bacterium]
MAESEIITLDDLPEELRRDDANLKPLGTSRHKAPSTADVRPVRSLARRTRNSNSFDIEDSGVEGVPTAKPELSAADEERLLREALLKAGGNKAVAARSLKLARSTFFSKCKRYGIS